MRPVISGLIVLATSLILKAGELSPGLQTLLSRTPDREELKVLVVLEDQALSGTLVGMSFLSRLSGYKVEYGELVLEQ